MRNVFKIYFPCVMLVFAFSISLFAGESEKAMQNQINSKTLSKKSKTPNCLNPNLCREAKESAAMVAFNALVDCNLYGASSQQCTDSITNAGLQSLYADFWCSLYPENAKLNIKNSKKDAVQNKRFKLTIDS
jgi:hypothetical protein